MEISASTARSIIGEISEALGRDVNLMDGEGRIIASTDEGRVGTVHPGAQKILRHHLDSLTVYSDDEYRGARKGINMPLCFLGERIGVIGISGEWREIERYRELIQKTAEALLRDAYGREQRSPQREELHKFLGQWLMEEGHPFQTSFVLRGQALDIDVLQPRRVTVLALASGHGDRERQTLLDRIEMAVRQLPSSLGEVLVHHYASHINLLLPPVSDGDLKEYLTSVAQSVLAVCGVSLAIGVDESPGSGVQVRESYGKAVRALHAALLGEGGIVFYKEILGELLLYEIPLSVEHQYLTNLFGAATGEEQREWLGLLASFYRNSGSISRTAEELYLHRNTLQYQLKKISRRTGYDPRDIRHAAVFQIALAFHQDLRRHGVDSQI